MHAYIYTYLHNKNSTIFNRRSPYDTNPVEEHDEEEHGEEVVRVEEDLVLGPTHFVGGRRVDDEHSEGHDSPGQVSSTLVGMRSTIH